MICLLGVDKIGITKDDRRSLENEAIALCKNLTPVEAGFIIMTHSIYTLQALANRKLEELKRIAADLGVTPAGNKRKRQTWIDAIIAHQAAQLQKIARPAKDEQAFAQGEFEQYIADQAHP